MKPDLEGRGEDRPLVGSLVVAAHGTASVQGRAVVEEAAAQAARQLGLAGAPVGYVDVCEPTLTQVLQTVAAQGQDRPIIVPYFLATGYHVRHDVPGAVDAGIAAGLSGATVTPALGVEPEILEALVDRVGEISGGSVHGVSAAPHREEAGNGGQRGVGAVILTAAGSSQDEARAEVAQTAKELGELLGVPGRAAFLTGPGPRPVEVVEEWAAHGLDRGEIVMVVHLLAPGYFADRAREQAQECGVRVTAELLGTHPAVVDLLVRRYREAALQA